MKEKSSERLKKKPHIVWNLKTIFPNTQYYLQDKNTIKMGLFILETICFRLLFLFGQEKCLPIVCKIDSTHTVRLFCRL